MSAKWLVEQWNDIKGNVKFAIIMAIFGAVGAVVKILVNGLHAWQQIVLLCIYLVLFGWCLFTTWEIIKPRAVTSTVSSFSRPAPSTAPATAPQVFMGTSILEIIFAGGGQLPTAVPNANVNIYRWFAVRYSAMNISTTPPTVEGAMWTINIVFDQPVASAAINFFFNTNAQPRPQVELRDLSPRSAIVVIHDEMPAALMELRFETATQPSPVPDKEASPP